MKHISLLPKWKRTLIKNFQEETTGQSLLELIQKQQDLSIANDGSKHKCKSEGTYIISDSSGTRIILGSNPDFGLITSINSHRSEISVLLLAFLFINEYYMYFMIIFDSQVSYFCENLEIVNKILQLRENSHHYDEYIITVDHDAVYLLNDYFPSRFNIQHVRNHQTR